MNLTSDICILGATPAGIAAAIAAAREGKRVILAERSAHIGGLPANGLGATDIHLRTATRGLFAAFVARNREYYSQTYGGDSEQCGLSKDGLHFEPSVAEQSFTGMLSEYSDTIRVLLNCEFDHLDQSASIEIDDHDHRITRIRLSDLNTGDEMRVTAEIFIDCTYEGDLMATAGIPYVIGRESRDDFHEYYAGVIYKPWRQDPVAELSTGEGDNRVQAYNYRLCITKDPQNRIPFSQPAVYDREEYISLLDDIEYDRWTGPITDELETESIGRIVNIIRLPNGKTDANNQHLSFLSTDLPEENYPWPEAGWKWRDAFALRLRSYTEGLLWFMANDSEVPEGIRKAVNQYGWTRDEYVDNGGFPRAVYVREARRMKGAYWYTQDDIAIAMEGGSSRIHPTSIASGCYAIDSHPVKKREPGMPNLEGVYSKSVAPYTVPFEVMISNECPNLLVPVAASASHVGFSTLRMEPLWMALGEAAGTAAALAINVGTHPDIRTSDIGKIQETLLSNGATVYYHPDLETADKDEQVKIQINALRVRK